MNNTADDKLKGLTELNNSIKEFNTRLEGLIQSRQKDKFEWLKSVNANFKEVNTIIIDIFESRKKDAIRNELYHAKQ
jgi:hypothetical protein